MSLHNIPLLNAILNALATGFLVLGRVAIYRGDERKHRQYMGAALLVSGIFLSFYLFYHFNSEFVTRYQGTGWDRPVYFAILLTHIPLATLMVPFILAAVYFAVRQDFRRHRQITRYLWPVWVYVSITGVLIYWMLYPMQALR